MLELWRHDPRRFAGQAGLATATNACDGQQAAISFAETRNNITPFPLASDEWRRVERSIPQHAGSSTRTRRYIHDDHPL
jgi:hypothetical protein